MKKIILTAMMTAVIAVASATEPQAARPESRSSFPKSDVRKPLSASERQAIQRALPAGKTLMGYLETAAFSSKTGGIYRMTDNGDVELVNRDKYTANGASFNQGWMRNGKLCVVGSGGGAYRYLEMNPFSGEITRDDVVPLQDPVTLFNNYMPEYIGVAYDSTNDRLYGYTHDEAGMGYIFFRNYTPDDPTNTQRVKDAEYDEVCVSLAYNPDDQTIYGINRENNLVKISSTGTQTVVAETNFPTRYAYAGMVYVPETKKFLWEKILTDYTYELVEIDPTTGSFTTLARFNDFESFNFMFFGNNQDDMNPIKAPELDEARFDNATGNGTVSYFVPSEYFNGGSVSGAMHWYATLDGEAYADGETTAGDIVDVKYEALSRGKHTFGFYVKQGQYGSGIHTFDEFIGYGVPNAPTDVAMTATEITWTPVDRCADGGYLDPSVLCYHVYVNGKEIGTTQESKYEYIIPVDQPYANYQAVVVADNGGNLSAEAKSESIRMGQPWKLDVFITPTAEEAAVCSAFNLDGDWDTWGAYPDSQDEWDFAVPRGQNKCDDWLFLPPMDFDDVNVTYEVAFDCANYSKWYPDMGFSVQLHKELDPRKVDQQIMEYRTFTNNSTYDTYSYKFAVNEPGTYYLSFWTQNEPYESGLYVRNIHVRKLRGSTAVPAEVTNLKAEGAPMGELKAKVEFDMPTLYISGATMPESNEIKTVVTLAGNKVEATGRPGEHVAVEVPSTQGYNRLSVMTYIDDVEGREAGMDVFTGIDIPDQVATMNGYVSEDNLSMTFEWTAPERGENGYYINPDDVEYVVMIYGETGWEEYQRLGKNVFTWTYSVAPGSPLQTVRLGIVPETIQGQSSTVGWLSDVLGTPHKAPLTEDFENANFKYGPIRVLRLDEDYYDSEWGVLDPSRLSPDMANESGISAYGRSEGPTKKGLLMLPKFDIEGLTQPGITFTFWTGTNIADVKILGETHDSNGFVELGSVPKVNGGWQELEFPFPDSFVNKKWVSIYIDAYFPYSDSYCLFSDYTVRGGVSGIGDVTVAGAGIRTGKGEIVISGYAGQQVAVYTLDGRMVWNGVATLDNFSIPTAAGIYVIRAGKETLKTIVR